MAKVFIIAIAGPSCAGKTELARYLGHLLACNILTTDAFYRDLSGMPAEQRHRVNFDHPAALDSELLIDQVFRLSQGETVDCPVYDFVTHTRSSQTFAFEPGRIFILEGLFALVWESLRRLASTKVFVDASDELCLRRRLERDIRERGRSAESVVNQFRNTVQPMANLHVRPTAQYADFQISGEAALAESARIVLAHLGAVEYAQPTAI